MNKNEITKGLFEKRIDFQHNERFKVPNEVYCTAKWSLPLFYNVKDELNTAKSLLSQFNIEEWSRHTKHMDPTSYIARFVRQKFHPELVTQAWCKFYECLRNYSIIPKEAISSRILTSLHLCEAPGAFISALNHYIASENFNLQWKWYVSSLNPDYEGNSLEEMIPDDRLLRHTYQNWYFGVDFTGDIRKYHNCMDLMKKIGHKVWLITADGSVDCSLDPGNQEVSVEYLHYCETMTALQLLERGGTFVLKIFTCFEDSTICLLYLLTILFATVSMFKPASSKSGNSEVYVICLNYRGTIQIEHIWKDLILPYKNGTFDSSKSMFDLKKIDTKFLNQLLHLSKYFKTKQIQTIMYNIMNFKSRSYSDSGQLHQLKTSVAFRYIHRYKLQSIPNNHKLVIVSDVSQFKKSNLQNFNFVNNLFKVDVITSVPINLSSQLLDIKLGLRISEIKSSRFCMKECLSHFKSKDTSKKNLYYSAEKIISETTTFISFKDFDMKVYYEFQKYFFYRIFDTSKSNLIFFQIPLVTNFLVGLMYILISVYKHVHLHKCGLLILYDSTGDCLLKVKSILRQVDEAYRCTPEPESFIYDVVQIVSPDLLHNSYFFEFVWNYNMFLESIK